MSVDTILIIVVLLGGAAGAFSFFRNPDAYISIGKSLFKELYPILAKRKPEEVEKAWRDSQKRAEDWDELNERPKTRNK